MNKILLAIVLAFLLYGLAMAVEYFRKNVGGIIKSSNEIHKISPQSSQETQKT